MIERFQKIEVVIVAFNANTEITTSYGTFIVAGAIALRSRLRGGGAYGDDADFTIIAIDGKTYQAKHWRLIE